MKIVNTLLLLLTCFSLLSQTASVQGQLKDAAGQPVLFANVILHNTADSSIAKVETSDEEGFFKIPGLRA